MDLQTPAWQLMPDAQPFILPAINGSRTTGALLIHGFTGTPREMRLIGEDLSARGVTCLGVRLSGHATRPEHLLRMRWEDWLASAEDGLHQLSGLVEQIYVVGLSMGGILTLLLASHYPLAGIVVMAAPHHLPNDPRLPFLPILSKVMPFQVKGKPFWFDMQAYTSHTSYPADTTAGYIELQKMLKLVQQNLGNIQAPARLIYSEDDPTVRKADGHAQLIHDELGSARKELFWIKQSGHVLTRDAQRTTVNRLIAEFILTNSAGEQHAAPQS